MQYLLHYCKHVEPTFSEASRRFYPVTCIVIHDVLDTRGHRGPRVSQSPEASPGPGQLIVDRAAANSWWRA
jgi:hypothetical protein